ncbi:MAG: hypothetical protein LBG24_11515 [Treponema sp.]|nr:hypothetical protein [Treponema sp.]
MRSLMETLGVEVLGDGRAAGPAAGTITPDEDIILSGDKLRIAPEDKAGLRVFCMDANGNPGYPQTHGKYP